MRGWLWTRENAQARGSSWGKRGPYITPKKLVRKSSEQFHKVSKNNKNDSLFNTSKDNNDTRRSLIIYVTFSILCRPRLYEFVPISMCSLTSPPTKKSRRNVIGTGTRAKTPTSPPHMWDHTRLIRTQEWGAHGNVHVTPYEHVQRSRRKTKTEVSPISEQKNTWPTRFPFPWQLS